MGDWRVASDERFYTRIEHRGDGGTTTGDDGTLRTEI